MRPGAAERMGVGYEQVKAVNPDIIYTAITGWGEIGPMRDKPGADVQAQYFTGFWSVSGAEGGTSRGLSPHGPDRRHDRQRRRAGSPDGTAGAQAHRPGTAHPRRHAARRHGAAKRGRIAEYLSTGELHQPQGSAAFATAPDQAFQCQWGDWIGVSVTSEDEWQRFAAVMRESEAEVEGIDDLASPIRAGAPTAIASLDAPSWPHCFRRDSCSGPGTTGCCG